LQLSVGPEVICGRFAETAAPTRPDTESNERGRCPQQVAMAEVEKLLNLEPDDPVTTQDVSLFDDTGMT
jgi:hypothetical protein